MVAELIRGRMAYPMFGMGVEASLKGLVLASLDIFYPLMRLVRPLRTDLLPNQ